MLLRQRELLSGNDLLLNGAWGIMQRANYPAVIESNQLPVAAAEAGRGRQAGRGCRKNGIFMARLLLERSSLPWAAAVGGGRRSFCNISQLKTHFFDLVPFLVGRSPELDLKVGGIFRLEV